MANREMQYRNDGMAYALQVVKNGGIEALEKEVKYRNATMLPSAVQKSAIKQFIDETKINCLDTVLIMSMMVLRDEFDFGQQRLDRFKKRFNLKTECLADGDISWKDLQDTLMEEVKTDTKIHNQNMFDEFERNG